MTEHQEPTTLEELLDTIDEAARDNDRLSVDAILDALGRRSFGPLLLVGGLFTLAPLIGDIPGVPTIIGTFVLLMAVQLLLRQEHIWLPQWLLRRSVNGEKAEKAVRWMQRPARFLDGLLRPRLRIFVEGAAVHAIAGTAALIAALMPLMELVPFSANLAGAALTALGLSLISRDGLLALVAVVITFGASGFVIYHFF